MINIFLKINSETYQPEDSDITEFAPDGDGILYKLIDENIYNSLKDTPDYLGSTYAQVWENNAQYYDKVYPWRYGDKLNEDTGMVERTLVRYDDADASNISDRVKFRVFLGLEDEV